MRGVQKIKVSLAGKQADVVIDPALTSAEEVRAAIDDMGFGATILGERERGKVGGREGLNYIYT